MGDDGRHRGLHGLVNVCRRERRQQSLLCLRRAQKKNPHRGAVGAGGPPFHEVIKLMQCVVTDGLVEPAIVGPGFAEENIEGLGVYGVAHQVVPSFGGIKNEKIVFSKTNYIERLTRLELSGFKICIRQYCSLKKAKDNHQGHKGAHKGHKVNLRMAPRDKFLLARLRLRSEQAHKSMPEFHHTGRISLEIPPAAGT